MYSKLLQDGNGFTNKSVISTHFSVFHSVYRLPLKPSQPVCGINILKLTWITDFKPYKPHPKHTLTCLKNIYAPVGLVLMLVENLS